MWGNLVSNVLTLLIVALVAVSGLLAWGKRQYSVAGPLEVPICLRVESGSNMNAVSRNLESQGAVSFGSIFRLGADYSGKSNLLKAGSFLVPAEASMEEIVEIVTVGGRSTCGTEIVYRIGISSETVQVAELNIETNRFDVISEFAPGEEATETYQDVRAASDTRYRVVLAEGVTSWQVVEALKGAEFLEGELGDIPGEGSLAPDSYEVRDGSSVGDLIVRMQEAQVSRISEIWDERVDGLPISSPEEALVLASIIEKETGLAEERRKVASVFVNRLREGMRLQTDPTVIYGVTEGKGQLGRGLRQSELRDDNPWNTYLIDGLPPTPIANPGKESLAAAVNPEVTDLLFFVADGTGGHAFARTLNEHNDNVAKWREIEAERASQN